MNWISFTIGVFAPIVSFALIRWVIIPAVWGFWLAGCDILKFRMRYVGKKYRHWYWVPIVYVITFFEHWWTHASDKFDSFTLSTSISYREHE